MLASFSQCHFEISRSSSVTLAESVVASEDRRCLAFSRISAAVGYRLGRARSVLLERFIAIADDLYGSLVNQIRLPRQRAFYNRDSGPFFRSGKQPDVEREWHPSRDRHRLDIGMKWVDQHIDVGSVGDRHDRRRDEQ